MVCGLLAAGTTRADPPPAPASIDGAVAVAKPAALPVGLSRGLELGVDWDAPAWLGLRAGWSRATEHTLTHTVSHGDTRLRIVGGLRHRAGRGTLGVGLRLGATLTHESRLRDQGERAGLEGAALRTSAWRLLPAADLELAIAVRVYRRWGVAVSAGPSVHLDGRDAIGGWFASAGVTWRP